MGNITIHVDGFDFVADSRHDELHIGDLVLAARAQLANPHDIRTAIRTAISDGLLSENKDFRFSRDGRESPRGRPGVAYELTRAGAIKVVTRLRTRKAIETTSALVDAFFKAVEMLRDGDGPNSADAARVIAEHAESTMMVGDVPHARTALADAIAFTAHANRASRQAIAGNVRKLIKRPSEYQCTMAQLPIVIEHLRGVREYRAVKLLGPKPLQRADQRQQRLFN